MNLQKQAQQKRQQKTTNLLLEKQHPRHQLIYDQQVMLQVEQKIWQQNLRKSTKVYNVFRIFKTEGPDSYRDKSPNSWLGQFSIKVQQTVSGLLPAKRQQNATFSFTTKSK